MVKEVGIQRTILDGVEAAGGWGRKASNMYSVGIPDLIIKMPSIPPYSFEVEVKKIDALPRKDDELVKLAHPLTGAQDETIKAINKAGGCAAVWIVYKTKTEDMIYVAKGKLDIPTKEEFLVKCLHRRIGPRGMPWSVAIRHLLEMQVNLLRRH